jgi:hypothetical protein
MRILSRVRSFEADLGLLFQLVRLIPEHKESINMRGRICLSGIELKDRTL